MMIYYGLGYLKEYKKIGRANLKDIFSNYKMNLLQTNRSRQYRFSNEDGRRFLKYYELFLKKLNGNIKKNIDEKSDVGIARITDSNYIIQKAKDGREGLNICVALENLIN